MPSRRFFFTHRASGLRTRNENVADGLSLVETVEACFHVGIEGLLVGRSVRLAGIEPRIEDAVGSEGLQFAVAVACRQKARGGTEQDAVDGDVPHALVDAACGEVAHVKGGSAVGGVFDRREMLLVFGARFAGDDNGGRGGGGGRLDCCGGKAIENEREQARAPLAVGDATELPQKLRHLLLLEEDAAGEPVLAHAPYDVRPLGLGFEGGMPFSSSSYSTRRTASVLTPSSRARSACFHVRWARKAW